MEREALKLALEALETKGKHHPRVYQAIAAIKAALAQPVQEQRPLVGLTDEDLLQIQENVRALGGKISLLRSLSIDIEAKLKQRNS
jgi:hypothetical protein